MIENVDKFARDLPGLTLHGHIPTGTTMALAARVVELLTKVTELEDTISFVNAEHVKTAELRCAETDRADDAECHVAKLEARSQPLKAEVSGLRKENDLKGRQSDAVARTNCEYLLVIDKSEERVAKLEGKLTDITQDRDFMRDKVHAFTTVRALLKSERAKVAVLEAQTKRDRERVVKMQATCEASCSRVSVMVCKWEVRFTATDELIAVVWSQTRNDARIMACGGLKTADAYATCVSWMGYEKPDEAVVMDNSLVSRLQERVVELEHSLSDAMEQIAAIQGTNAVHMERVAELEGDVARLEVIVRDYNEGEVP